MPFNSIISQCRGADFRVSGMASAVADSVVCRAAAALSAVAAVVPALLMALFVLASCSSDDEAVQPVQPKVVQVQLTLAVGQPAAGNAAKRGTTRAADDTDWTQYSPKEDGVGIENYIDVSRLHIVLYDTEGTVAAIVRNLRMTTAADGTYNVFGNMTIPVDRLSGTGAFTGRIMVFANVDDPLPAETDGGWRQSLADIASTAFSYDKTNSAGSPSTLTLDAIPMWGVTYASNIELNGGESNDLGTIDLLRAMSKVTVHLTKAMRDRGFSFKSITLSRHNTGGCVMPAADKVTALTAAEGTKNLTYADCFHLPADVTADTEALSFLKAEGDTVSQTLYIPEYDNGTSPATVSVALLYNGKEAVSGTLEFKDYTDGSATGSAYNICRNHHYRFEVYSSGLKVDLHVVPWVKIEHTAFTW